MAILTSLPLPTMLSHQWQLLQSRRRWLLLAAGIGSGKTRAGAWWALHKALAMPSDAPGLVAANSYAQLHDVVLRQLYACSRDLGISLLPGERPRRPGPFSLTVSLGQRRAEILCRSLEEWPLLSGLEVAWFWADEAWQACEAAVEVLIGRLRCSRAAAAGVHLQGLLTTTPDDPAASWLHRMFVSRHDPASMEVFRATTGDNPHLPDGYLDQLRQRYTEPLFRRMVLAEWVSLSEGLVYPAFRRDSHVSAEAEFDPALPIRWSHDFNIGAGKPMSSCLAQIKRLPGPDGRRRPELHVFAEIVVDSARTGEAIEEFRGGHWALPGSQTIVYGDAAGRARDTRGHLTDYQLLAAAGFDDQQVPAANPPVRDRHNAVNALLGNAGGDVRLRLHPRCRNLIEGLSTVRLKPGAGYAEVETRVQHVTTALGYLIAAEFPIHPAPRTALAAFWK
jgi:hypothetical protein